MSYLVFARKFRPQTFASVVGQEHISRALQNALLRNRIPHALLLTGPRGVGKTTSARLIARALNCQNIELPIPNPDSVKAEDIEPCGECTNCKEIAAGSSLAVWEIDGASNNSVDNVRELIESLRSTPPPGSRYKIYIIDEVHMLSTAAFNALLKSLEEPPPNTLFIFATTEPHKIPETVISRCQRHDFRRLSSEAIVQCLKGIAETESVQVDDSVFNLIARKAQGGMRDAQSMFDRLLAFSDGKIEISSAKKIFGVVDSTFFEGLAQAVIVHDSERCFELVDEVFTQSLDVRTFLADFVLFWRNLFLVALATKGKEVKPQAIAQRLDITKDEAEQLITITKSSTPVDIHRLFDLVTQVADRALSSGYPRYIVESGLVKMATLSEVRPVAEIIASLEELKKKGLELPTAGVSSFASKASAKQNREITPTFTAASAPSEVVVEESELPSPKNFSPSWKEFVGFVKDRSEVILSSFLRRASVKRFELGTLDLEAVSFDAATLNRQDYQQSIKKHLYSYSGHSDWRVSVVEGAAGQPPEADVTSGSMVRSQTTYAQGSIAQLDHAAQVKEEKRQEKEAKEQDAVKAVLSVLGGRIDRVSLLKQ